MNNFRYIISELIIRTSKTFYIDSTKIYLEIVFMPIFGESDKSTNIITLSNGNISNILLYFGSISILVPIIEPSSKNHEQNSSYLNNIIIFYSSNPISYGFFIAENTFTLDFYMYIDNTLVHTRIAFPFEESFHGSLNLPKDDSLKQKKSSFEDMDSPLIGKISADLFLKLFKFITLFILYNSTKEKNKKNEDDI